MATVPDKYDVVINSQGYMFADLEAVKAQYGYTPTFVPRSNTQGDYGDNQQDFWMSVSQKDWSLGEQQRFYRADEQRSRRFWTCLGVNIDTPGEVTLRNTTRTLTAAASVQGLAQGSNVTQRGLFTTSTTVYDVQEDGTITSLGAHGAGGSGEALTFDGDDIYISSGSGTDVRKLQSGVFTTFSVDQQAGLEYLNNALYGRMTNSLNRFDTSGTLTNVFTFRSSDAGSSSQVDHLLAFGGKLVILTAGPHCAELWLYDGVAPAKIADLPNNFNAGTYPGPGSLAVAGGVIFVGGYFVKPGNSFARQPAVFFYSNGQLGLLWKSIDYGGTGIPGAGVAPFDNGLIILDEVRGYLLYYNLVTGGIHAVGTFTTGGASVIVGCNGYVLLQGSGTALYQWPTSTTTTSGTITTSLFDFDSSLTKIFRGVIVEFDAATDGNGGTIDIAYRVNDVDSTYTTLQSTATSGTEYLLTNITGRSISIRVTINKGSSTSGPKLKRISVRAVPKQSVFRKETFIINCTGRDGESPLVLRDDTMEAKDGLTLATALRTAATTTNPISITDEFGTFTGVIELEGFELRRVRPNEFLAVVPVREV